MSRTWKGEVECGVCGAMHNVEVDIFDEQEIAEPMIPLECVDCGAFTCHPHINTDEESDEVWEI